MEGDILQKIEVAVEPQRLRTRLLTAFTISIHVCRDNDLYA